MLRNTLLLVCLLWSETSSAESYMCPNTFRAINTGDTMQAVMAACNQPSAVSVRQDTVQTPMQVTRWVYAIDPVNSGSLALALSTLAISIKDGQVVQIEKDGLLTKVADPIFCTSGGRVKEGDAANAVLLACGSPSYIAEQQVMIDSKKNIVIWTYNFGPYKPQAILEFENNVLMRILNDSLGH